MISWNDILNLFKPKTPVCPTVPDNSVKIQELQNNIDILNQELVDVKHKSAADWDLQYQQIQELQRKLDNSNNPFPPQLPKVFVEATDVYSGQFIVKTIQQDYSVVPKGWEKGGHITLTSFMYRIINNADVRPGDDALTAFNKILGAQQQYTTYILDNKQWGEVYAENWTPAVMTIATQKDDCESLAALAISAFQYYQIQENKYPNAYAFVGTGLYNKASGHGFPCLYIDNGKIIDESLYIGESTLHNPVPLKQLKDCKDLYWINWGANSFWHDFRIKPESIWWVSTAGIDEERKVLTPEEKKEKLEHIKKFWEEK